MTASEYRPVRPPRDWSATLSKRTLAIHFKGKVETRAYRTPRAARQAWRYWSAVVAQRERLHLEQVRGLLADSGGFLTRAVMHQAPTAFMVRVVLSGWTQAHDDWLVVSGFTDRYPFGEVVQARVALGDEVGPGALRVARPAEVCAGDVVDVLYVPREVES